MALEFGHVIYPPRMAKNLKNNDQTRRRMGLEKIQPFFIPASR